MIELISMDGDNSEIVDFWDNLDHFGGNVQILGGIAKNLLLTPIHQESLPLPEKYCNPPPPNLAFTVLNSLPCTKHILIQKYTYI